MPSSSVSQRKRLGVFLRMVEEDTSERVSVAALNYWAEHYGVKQTEYIHRALREKMERDMANVRQTIQSQSPVEMPPLAKHWLTPDETALVKEQQSKRYGQRFFNIDPNSLLNPFVD